MKRGKSPSEAGSQLLENSASVNARNAFWPSSSSGKTGSARVSFAARSDSGKSPALPPSEREALLKVQRHGIVDGAADALRRQMILQRISSPSADADDELVEDVVPARGLARELHAALLEREAAGLEVPPLDVLRVRRGAPRPSRRGAGASPAGPPPGARRAGSSRRRTCGGSGSSRRACASRAASPRARRRSSSPFRRRRSRRGSWTGRTRTRTTRPSAPAFTPLYAAPSDWHASSRTGIPFLFATSRIGSMSAHWP